MAVLNAIYNACGVRIHEIPATPAKVKDGLDAIASGRKPEVPAKYFLGSDLYEELEDIKANPVKYEGEPDFFRSLGGTPRKNSSKLRNGPGCGSGVDVRRHTPGLFVLRQQV